MMANEPTRQNHAKEAQQSAIQVAGIPILPEEKALYFNGFAIAVGSGDIVLTLMRNGVPIQTLNVSFTVAKTLGSAIADSIEKLEEMTTISRDPSSTIPAPQV